MKKTPIQQAIEKFEKFNDNLLIPPSEIIKVIADLLPTEESFAKECFSAGQDCEALYRRGFKSDAVTFEQHYSQFKKQ